MNRYTTTWIVAYNSTDVECIEDPLLGSFIPKEAYYDTYAKVLDQLDGETMSDYFDFFFCSNPVSPSLWGFRDNSARSDFLDWCQDEGLVKSIKEVHAGETDLEKEEREKEELRIKKCKELQKEKLRKKKNMCKINKNDKKREQMEETVKNIKMKLEDPDLDDDKKTKLKIKLDKINLMLNL